MPICNHYFCFDRYYIYLDIYTTLSSECKTEYRSVSEGMMHHLIHAYSLAMDGQKDLALTAFSKIIK